MRALITTTINVPYNLRDWRASGMSDDDVIIVAGDQKTPHDEVEKFLETLPGVNHYLSPTLQVGWATSEVVGWNSIQRRNIALLEALRLKPEWIMTVDDDNYPTSLYQWDVVHESFGIRDISVVDSESGWYDVGECLAPPTSHRGYPISQRGETPVVRVERHGVNVGVVASLWQGDPDVDAVTRLALGKVMSYGLREACRPGIALDLGTWSPFNSQAVAYRTALAPLMMVWPGVGRYDDIWASFLARRVMDAYMYTVWYGEPLVRQDRNEHNLLKDLEVELFGMRHNDELIEALRSIKLDHHDVVVSALSHCYGELYRLEWLPEQTKDGFEAWLEDLGKVL